LIRLARSTASRSQRNTELLDDITLRRIGEMGINLAINQSMIMQCQTEEFISVCARAGFKAVELRVPKLKESLFHISHRQLSELIKKHDISVLSLNSIDDFSMVPEENLELLTAECEFVGRMCEMFGCPMVVTPVARWFDSPPSVEQVKATSQERLRHVSDILSKFGVKIGFEPICFPEFTVRDFALAQEIIAGSGAESIGFVLDIYNLFRGGIQPDDIAGLNYPTYLIHLNDAPDSPLENLHVMYNRVFPGEGVANAQAWVEAAIRSGYQGYFSLEMFQQQIWDMSPQDAAVLCYNKMRKFAESVD